MGFVSVKVQALLTVRGSCWLSLRRNRANLKTSVGLLTDVRPARLTRFGAHSEDTVNRKEGS